MQSLLLEIPPDRTNPWLWIGVAMLALVVVLWRPLLRRRKDPLEQAPQPGQSQQRSVQREMSDLLVELSSLARQISAQLDSRAEHLESLIRRADERIAALKTVSPTRPKPAEELSPPQGEENSRHVEVYALADKGRTAQEIAQHLGRPRGEIELILALRSTAH